MFLKNIDSFNIFLVFLILGSNFFLKNEKITGNFPKMMEIFFLGNDVAKGYWKWIEINQDAFFDFTHDMESILDLKKKEIHKMLAVSSSFFLKKPEISSRILSDFYFDWEMSFNHGFLIQDFFFDKEVAKHFFCKSDRQLRETLNQIEMDEIGFDLREQDFSFLKKRKIQIGELCDRS